MPVQNVPAPTRTMKLIWNKMDAPWWFHHIIKQYLIQKNALRIKILGGYNMLRRKFIGIQTYFIDFLEFGTNARDRLPDKGLVYG